jgi:hypothetical protein
VASEHAEQFERRDEPAREGAEEQDVSPRAKADWTLIRRMLADLLGDEEWPAGLTVDDEAVLEEVEGGAPIWRVGHHSYQVLRRDPGEEEILETVPTKQRRITWGTILEERDRLAEG